MKIVIVADQKSLDIEHNYLQNTYEMFCTIAPLQDVIIQIPANLAPQLNNHIPPENIFLEASAKGTAPAVGLAAIKIFSANPEELIIVAYADHPVTHQTKLKDTLHIAQKLASRLNKLILIGVNPTSPETKYGYAKIGKAIEEINGYVAFEMVDFKEKPEIDKAKQYISSWRYLWNTGYMVVSANKLLEIYKSTMPELYSKLFQISSHINEPQFSDQIFDSITKLSIDNGLYERIDHKDIAIIAADLNINKY